MVLMGEVIVMGGAFITIFALLICCINIADDTSNSKYSRARARARRERQLRDRRRSLN
jgi:hypothetical protein